MRTVWVAASLMAVLFAGCAESEAPLADDPAFDELETKATATTGVIRGVVVDAAIVPVPGATVRVLNTAMEANTTANGAFAFQGVQPGTYFLEARKDGFNGTQVSVTVQAGVDKPPIVRVLLQQDPSQQPFVEVLQFEGFIMCSNRLIIIGIATCSAVGFGDDDFARDYEPSFRPQWVQSELVWESTQFFGEELSFSITCISGPPCPSGQVTIARHEGPSPLLLKVNATAAEEFMLGAGQQPITVRVFAHGHSATDIPEEMIYDTLGIQCAQWPILFQGCIRFGGIGLVVDQKFTAYTHIFHKFEPPVEWRFTQDGPPPQP